MTEPHPSLKKLKRGLHDLSPLFQAPQAPSVQTAAEPASSRLPFEVQFLSVCVPDHEGDAFLANAYLASQMVRRTDLFVSLVSLLPGFSVSTRPEETFRTLELLDARISRLTLSHQELWTMSQGRFPNHPPVPFPFPFPSGGISQDFLVFLEFEPSQFRSLARIALLLDRLVLFVQPHVEGLREAYRLVKTFCYLNREIEFFLLFRGKTVAKEQKEFLFERFSLITSRFLWITPGWLGELDFPEKKEKKDRSQISQEEHWEFNPDPLIRGEGLKRPLSPEKSRFWRELQKILRTRMADQLFSP